MTGEIFRYYNLYEHEMFLYKDSGGRHYAIIHLKQGLWTQNGPVLRYSKISHCLLSMLPFRMKKHIIKTKLQILCWNNFSYTAINRNAMISYSCWWTVPPASFSTVWNHWLFTLWPKSHHTPSQNLLITWLWEHH